jgi:hypothetical protein
MYFPSDDKLPNPSVPPEPDIKKFNPNPAPFVDGSALLAITEPDA